MNKSKEIEKHETFGKRRVTHFISGLMVAWEYIRRKT